MKKVTAILSMLHEMPGRDSASRLFRGEPVLSWTLERLARCQQLSSIAVLCWEDHLPAVEAIAGEKGAYVLAKGPRVHVPAIEAIAAARKWADGWRGGLLSTCDFDLGFHGPWVRELQQKLESDAVLLVDPSAGLVDFNLIDEIIEHTRRHEELEMCFTSAAPGLGGVLLKSSILEKLSTGHPGRSLHYMPEQPMHDPCSTASCYPVSAPVARSLERFKLDSDRQISRIEQATTSLNGQLIKSRSEELVLRMSQHTASDALPREVVLELNTQRATSPVYWPGKHLEIVREPMTPGTAAALFQQIAVADDMRLTIAGVGDPLLNQHFLDIVELARHAGIHAIHVETDLVGVSSGQIAELAAAPIDVISIHMPAATIETYQRVMGVDALLAVLESVKTLILERQKRGRGVPLVVPTFTKCALNLAEMEAWYDQWLTALGTAVIVGPGDCAGQIPNVSVAEMGPPQRKACARIQSRMMVLCDGRIVSCEQDITGRQVMGRVGKDEVGDVWKRMFGQLREEHGQGRWAQRPVCASCKDWHRR